MKILLVASARPNFMKIAPIIRELKAERKKLKGKRNLDYILVHTGQHYDFNMSETFLRILGFQNLIIP